MRVGLYNYIPDIGDDHFKSYVDFIQKRWDCLETGIKLELVTKRDKYDPYGNLDTFLGTGQDSFDLIEADMARSSELVGKVVNLQAGSTADKIDISRYFNASTDAAKNGNLYLGFPTLACGNFLIEIKRKGRDVDRLDGDNYRKFKKSAAKAVQYSVYDGRCPIKKPITKPERLIGGKIDDSDGWYLPSIYLDAVVDIEGPGKMETSIQNVLDGNPNPTAIDRLKEFYGYFKNICKELDQEDIEKDVADGINANFFGFSEKWSVILKERNYDGIEASAVFSPPFGKENYALIFNDALVMNKKKYENADQKRKDAMHLFAKFFTSKLI